MEEESRSSIKNLCTKATFRMANATAMAEALLKLVKSTKAASMRIIWMVWVSSTGLMGVSMKENSSVVENKAKASTSGPMARFMMATSRTTSAVASVTCTTQMVKPMKVIGEKARRMVKVLTYSQMAQATR